MKKIAVFGDSYADDKYSPLGDIPWPKLLEKKLNTPIDFYGRSGTSIWWSFKNFLNNYKKYDTIIFCYSDYNRIHYLPHNLENKQSEKPDYLNEYGLADPNDFNILKNIVEVYWNYLQDNELDLFIYKNIFSQINTICKNNDINLISLFPFEKYESLIINSEDRIGSIITNISEASYGELVELFGRNLAGRHKLMHENRSCHLSQENNKILCDLIYPEILSNTHSIYNFKKFCMSNKEISKRYFSDSF